MATNENSIFKTLLGLVSNPMLLAGAAGLAGYYYFGRGKPGKMPYYAAIGGAAAGYFAGKGLQTFLLPAASSASGITAKGLPKSSTTVIPSSAATGALLPETTVSVATGSSAGSSSGSGATIPTESAQKKTESNIPIGDKDLGEMLDTFGSFDDGEFGSLTAERGWSEEDALDNLAEVDMDIVSLGTRRGSIGNGNGHKHARGQRR